MSDEIGSPAPAGPTIAITSDRFRGHITGAGHPESPARIDAVRQVLDGLAQRGLIEIVEPHACPSEHLLEVHSERYLKAAQGEIEAGVCQLSTGDTNVCPQSWELACLGAGALTQGIDLVVRQEAGSVFCAVRPPGHHATPQQGMGFCVLSNVAIAARYAQRHHGIGRVLIIDWDVHHGNGTQDVFYNDPSVLFFSTHQHPLYPGTGPADETGAGDAIGTTINVPLPAGTGRREILAAMEGRLVDAANAFQPELVLISAGFDSRRGDPLGRFTLEDQDFADMTRVVQAIAADHAEGRLLSALEGGYNLTGLAAATKTHVATLAGEVNAAN
ncbi:MAG: histone deacetylase [Planctomycetota bacterium]